MDKEFETKGYKSIDLNFGYEDLLIHSFDEACAYLRCHGGRGKVRGQGTGRPNFANYVQEPSLNVYMEYLASIVHRDVLTSIVEKETGLKLIPTYSYTRKYFKGNRLNSHKDRPCNEVSLTWCLSGPEWEITFDGTNVTTKKGSAWIYKGCDLRHCRLKPAPDDGVHIFCGWVDSNGRNLNASYDDGQHKEFYQGWQWDLQSHKFHQL